MPSASGRGAIWRRIVGISSQARAAAGEMAANASGAVACRAACANNRALLGENAATSSGAVPFSNATASGLGGWGCCA